MTESAGSEDLRQRVESVVAAWAAAPGAGAEAAARDVVGEVLDELEAGRIRAARAASDGIGGWQVEAWVKAAILLAFRLPGAIEQRDGPITAGRDKAALGVVDVLSGPGARAAVDAGAPWRIVPGGTSIRRGAYLAPGVVVMTPAFVNTGAWVGGGAMVDSHVLVGSCAQVGRDVHLAAGVQVGGVLEPPGARPVIIEDGAFVGGGAGLYEGVTIGRGAVVGAGVVLTGQSRLVDLISEQELRGSPEAPLVVPPGAVVVPGTRPVSSEWGRRAGIAVSVPVVVKYRDEGTDGRVALEEALR